MSKLHELIAVEPDLKATAKKIESETLNVFSKKQGLFQGQHRSYEPINDDGLSLPEEKTEMTTTVDARVDYTLKTVFKYLDAMTSKEKTNTVATADVVIGEDKILEGVPAVILLSLEQEFKELRRVFELIPTLDLSEIWKFDKDMGVYKSERKESFKTEKLLTNHVKAEATKEHPAQVEVYTKDTPIGRWYTTKYSGMKTPAEKHEFLTKLDELIRAFKQARQRANQTTVADFKISENIKKYLSGQTKA